MTATGYFDVETCSLEEFRALTAAKLEPESLRYANRVEKNIPVYSVQELEGALADPNERGALLTEWGWVLGASSGVVVLEGAYPDSSVIDAATAIYERVIERERSAGAGEGDHFATAGANDRIWNALQKLCEADAEVFAKYFGNPKIAAVSEAWLGPNYQMTAQINVVRPGGQAQEAHRDYHLGFQTEASAARYPAHAHDLSAVMTLQGAIAHCNMSVESGPTKLLPFSQLYRPGYMAYRRADFRAHFEDRFVQLPLSKGDALFFNPALFHAAGENRTTDTHRMANLLQVSSAFGRAMESIDREAMCRRLYPVIKGLTGEGAMTAPQAAAAIAAAAEGYPFPTNLDSDPPVGGLAPESQAALFHRALAEEMTPETFEAELARQSARREP
ncbi:MAG: phytanoyl-CoA dioxygenase family protein [Paracoccaceae bacterium]|nr:phytanoyl-CoA dioxygenase family protein [Paracoccaceae bacterium]